MENPLSDAEQGQDKKKL